MSEHLKQLVENTQLEINPESLESFIWAGCRIWNNDETKSKQLVLFPEDWYDLVPEGMLIEYIDNTEEPFERGKTDNDTRFGLLAFGVRI